MFRLFSIAPCLSRCASTEQGAPARSPCTRALSVPRLNHWPLLRLPSFRLRASRAGTDTLPAWLYLSRASCPLARPCGSTRQ